jgi:hypothetical protein
MSTIHLSRSASLFTISLAAGLLVIGTASTNASYIGIQGDLSSGQEASARATASAGTTQQSSASAWSESNGDHGMTVTTTRSGDSTSCMVVEWKRENGGIKKWQYRCDTPQP